VAASGGYWIAAPAQKIIADPNTITGSIGVLTGKLNLSGLYNLLGMSTDYVATSDNATLFSDQQNFTPQQEAYIQKSLQDTYSQFTQGVAAGRHLSVDAVDKIGKGREWTGAQAKDIGLVDELGGFDRAVVAAKELAHIPDNESVSLMNFPEEKSLFQQIFAREKQMMDESRASSVLGMLARLGLQGDAARRFNSAATPESIDSALRRIAAQMEPIQARVPYELHIR
jgi:protease-4